MSELEDDPLVFWKLPVYFSYFIKSPVKQLHLLGPEWS